MIAQMKKMRKTHLETYENRGTQTQQKIAHMKKIIKNTLRKQQEQKYSTYNAAMY